jgi:hypothetical protein
MNLLINLTILIISFSLPLSFACLHAVQRPVDIKNRPRIPIPDEDPYSEAAGSASSSGSSGLGGSGSAGEGNGKDVVSVIATREQLLMQQQPKLPPRDNMYPQVLKVIQSSSRWSSTH